MNANTVTPAEYHCGEQVAVTITGTVVACDEHGLLIRREGAGAINVLSAGGDIVERLTPAEGEPQPCDVWRDRDGTQWFARDDAILCSSSLTNERWSTVNKMWGPLTLVYRPEPEPSTDSTDESTDEAVVQVSRVRAHLADIVAELVPQEEPERDDRRDDAAWRYCPRCHGDCVCDIHPEVIASAKAV